MLTHEPRNKRRDVGAPEAQRGVDAQQALRAGLGRAQQFTQILNLAQDAARVCQIQLAFGCEAHASGSAVDQTNTQSRLHLCQPPAYRRRGDAQLARRGAQAARAGQRSERLF